MRWIAIALLCLTFLQADISAQELPPKANSPDIEQRVLDLESQLRDLQSQQEREREGLSAAAGSERAVYNVSAAEMERASHATIPESISGPAPEYPTVKLGGFFQTDAGWIHQDAANRAAVGDVQDGAGFRRARLAATGDAWDNVSYKLEMDFAFPGRPTFMDV